MLGKLLVSLVLLGGAVPGGSYLIKNYYLNSKGEVVEVLDKEQEHLLQFKFHHASNSWLSADEKKAQKQKNLIAWEDKERWVKKVVKYSVKNTHWPEKLIYINDKSDSNLARLLRNSCYEHANTLVQTTHESNNKYTNKIKESFQLPNGTLNKPGFIELCSYEEGEETGFEKNPIQTLEYKSMSDSTLASKYQMVSGADEKVKDNERYNEWKTQQASSNSAENWVRDFVVNIVKFKDNKVKYELRFKTDGQLYENLWDIPTFKELIKPKTS